jgi:hypothetical protein
MTNEELEQIRTIVTDAAGSLEAKVDARIGSLEAKVDARFDRVEAKLDRVIDRADDVLTGVVRLRTEAENRDVGIREELDSLRERVEALEAQRRE